MNNSTSVQAYGAVLGMVLLFFDPFTSVAVSVVNPVEVQKLKANNGENFANFGYSVAISGDTIVVGANEDNSTKGSAYVFEKFASGWIQSARLTANDRTELDFFGSSVAISGDTIVVGAYGDDSYTGSAYVFVKPVGGWLDITETAKLTASDRMKNDWFGGNIAISGETIVVGAYGDDNSRGAAYIYERPAGGWSNRTEATKLTAREGMVGDFFGSSVAISEDTIVIGAEFENRGKGSAYIFTKDSGGWSRVSRLVTYGEGLGNSVEINGSTVVVGALATDFYKGSAYVFQKFSGDWSDVTEIAKLTASNGKNSDWFGQCIDISGNTIVVGTMEVDSHKGAVYLFEKHAEGWSTMTETVKLTASDGGVGDLFGHRVAISGDTIVVGAHVSRNENGLRAGSVYVFTLRKPSSLPYWSMLYR